MKRRHHASVLARILLLLGMLAVVVMPLLSANAQHTFDVRPGSRLSFAVDVFEVGSSALSNKGVTQFKGLAEYLQKRPNLSIEIAGYTDNTGDSARNVLLSEARSRSVKAVLMANGVAEARIQTRGGGASSPIASNETEEGRAQNRRIEVVGLSFSTKRPLTTGQQTPLKPEAHITAMFPPVQSLTPWDADWQTARLGEPVYEYHRLMTGAKARVEITFANKNRLQLTENSLAVVYGNGSGNENENGSERTANSNASATVKPNEQITLVKGGLWVKITSLPNNQSLSVRTPNGEVALNKSSAKIELDPDARSLVSVHEGQANVRSVSGSAIFVEKNFGVRVLPNEPPEAPRRLPLVPELLTPNISDSLAEGRIAFAWRKRSLRVRCEIANSINFQRPVYAEVLETDSVSVVLGDGEWYLKLSAIDDVGLESRSSIYLLHVVQPAKPFRFYALTLLLFMGGVFCAWWGGITEQRRVAMASLGLLGLGCLSFFVLHW
jgi:OmpA family/FecR protein